MFSAVISGAIYGVESYLVSVETDVSQGIPGFEMVGKLNGEVKEARERVRVALKNSGICLPPSRITVNLSPADIRKSGTAFDLPIAISTLAAVGQIPQESLEKCLFIGELGLNGEVKPVNGVLPIVLQAIKEGIECCIVPIDNLAEGTMVKGIKILGVETLEETIEFLDESKSKQDERIQNQVQRMEEESKIEEICDIDFADIAGQENIRRAVEIAAAGFHHLMVIGPPGSGKTMVAKRIPTILPNLTDQESLEVSKIYSISGMLHAQHNLMKQRPFCSPHHTISEQALAGGGRVPRPGVISLAHRGVLFLDEAVHFSNAAIEVLRQPMEDKRVQIARSYGTFTYPADFMLVVAMNPCPCGYYPDRNRCRCSEEQVKRYLSKISGPILDRIDICIEAPRVEVRELNEQKNGESSAQMRKRIEVAREMQRDRFRNTTFRFNSDLGPLEIKKYCRLGNSEKHFVERAFERMQLSARAYHKILKVARTIADLDGEENISQVHLAEAICYRNVDQKYW